MPPSAIVESMYDSGTLVFGHRGASADAPANTLPAFALAAEQGAHGVELDVHRSRDGFPVVIHDFSVDELTDGKGRVADLTLAELKVLDAGTKFAPSFAGTQIPTLDEVFEAVGRRLFINVEIKSNNLMTDGLEQVVADCIARHAMAERVIVSSFNPLALRRFRAVAPDVPIGFLYAPGVPDDVHVMLAGLPYEAYHPYYAIIDAGVVETARREGWVINAWTVNEPAEALRLRDLGVNGIITDVPAKLLAALRA